jgi:hypothetical protein
LLLLLLLLHSPCCSEHCWQLLKQLSQGGIWDNSQAWPALAQLFQHLCGDWPSHLQNRTPSVDATATQCDLLL